MWSTKQTVPSKPGSFHEFIVTRASIPGPGSPVGMLANAVEQLFPSGVLDHHAKLTRLTGTYEMIRRLWLPADTDDCLCCVAKFTDEKGVIVYRMREHFVSQYPVDENYEGYTFLFSSSFWLVAHERTRQSVRFLTMHECGPNLSADADVIHISRGNMIAVTGNGSSVSHPFVLRRIKDTEFSSSILSKEQTKLRFSSRHGFDKRSFDHLYI